MPEAGRALQQHALQRDAAWIQQQEPAGQPRAGLPDDLPVSSLTHHGDAVHRVIAERSEEFLSDNRQGWLVFSSHLERLFIKGITGEDPDARHRRLV